MTRSLYLDHNATAPLRPEAMAAVNAALALTGNASSVHGFGRAARRLIEEARQSVAAFAGAAPAGVVFTSGGTEANNLALSGHGGAGILVSAGEHPSVLNAAPQAQRLALLPDGRLDLAALATALKAAQSTAQAPILVSVMWANNETGVLQPVREIAEIIHRHAALFHCDAVQAAGKLPLAMAETGIDFMSLSAHKIGGPQGVGALVLAPGREVAALLRGGGQERSYRAGTENLPGIAGFGAAARAAKAALPRQQELAQLRDRLETGLRGLAPEVRIFGAEAPRLANTSCFGVPALKAETQVMALDLAGVAVSAGSACSSGKVEPSHVLEAMGVSAAEAATAIRVSFGWDSRAADVDEFLAAWAALYSRCHAA
jgi:cysteine desulfurase